MNGGNMMRGYFSEEDEMFREDQRDFSDYAEEIMRDTDGLPFDEELVWEDYR